MELKNFVTATITSIAEGLLEAQAHATEHKYKVAPRNEAQNRSVPQDRGGDALECVEFEVAVTVSKAVEGTAEAKVFVVSGDVNASISQEQVSRVKFPVWVKWPRSS